MAFNDKAAEYLRRADEARNMAACASNFMIMDELMDVAAAWRALAAETKALSTISTPVVRVARQFTPKIRLVPPLEGKPAA